MGKTKAGRTIEELEQEADNDPLLTPVQIARLFNVARSTAWKWAATGKIPSVRMPGGGPRKVRLSDIQRVLGEVAANRAM